MFITGVHHHDADIPNKIESLVQEEVANPHYVKTVCADHTDLSDHESNNK